MNKEELENLMKGCSLEAARKRKIYQVEENLKDKSIINRIPVSMIPLKDEYLKVKDNADVYSEAIKNLFIDGWYIFPVESFTAIKEEIFKVYDFILDNDIYHETPVWISRYGSDIHIFIFKDENYKTMMNILQE